MSPSCVSKDRTKTVELMLEQYWKAHVPALKAFLQKRSQDPMLTDDLLQEVFLRAQERLDQLQDATKVRAWLFQMTRNVLTDHYRAQQRRRRHINQYQQIPEAVTDETKPINCCTASDCLPILVQHLEEPYRSAMLGTAYGTTAQKEYAEANGINYTTLKSHIQRARRQLRIYVEIYCPNLLPEECQPTYRDCCTLSCAE